MDYHRITGDAKYLVFLDIDGVFTSLRAQLASANSKDIWNVFDPIAINFMNSIHNTYSGVYYVLISTWKENLSADDSMIAHWILTAFRNAGFTGEFYAPWKTNPDNLFRKGENRAHEIKEYLETYASYIKDYIIFDDNDYGFDRVLGKKRLIKTSSDNGILVKHMLDAKSIMGHWELK